MPICDRRLGIPAASVSQRLPPISPTPDTTGNDTPAHDGLQSESIAISPLENRFRAVAALKFNKGKVTEWIVRREGVWALLGEIS